MVWCGVVWCGVVDWAGEFQSSNDFLAGETTQDAINALRLLRQTSPPLHTQDPRQSSSEFDFWCLLFNYNINLIYSTCNWVWRHVLFVMFSNAYATFFTTTERTNAAENNFLFDFMSPASQPPSQSGTLIFSSHLQGDHPSHELFDGFSLFANEKEADAEAFSKFSLGNQVLYKFFD